MSETRRIICDHCGKDLTWGGDINHWRIGIYNEQVPAGPPNEYGCVFVCDVLMSPHIEKDMHFCGLGCLKKKFWCQELFGKTKLFERE